LLILSFSMRGSIHMPSSAFATISEQNKSMKIMNCFIIDEYLMRFSGIKMSYHLPKIIRFKENKKPMLNN